MHKGKEISHLILSDGGLKGMVYIGILQYMHMENILDDIKHIAGTSIGAYFAVIFALRMPCDLIQSGFLEIIEKINNESIALVDFDSMNNLFSQKGLLSLDFMFHHIIQFVREKYDCDDMTFADFVKRTGVNIYVSCSNINTGKMKIFSLETTPDVMILQTVRASMSIPFVFEPIEIDGEIFTDGCLTNALSSCNIFTNIPRKNKLEILLRANDLEMPVEIDQNENLQLYFTRVLQTLYSNQFNKPVYDDINYNVLNLYQIPYDGVIKFHITNNKMKIDITDDDFDRLVLTGFIKISEYFR